jgi:2-dehydro-3-deoxygluconokinase
VATIAAIGECMIEVSERACGQITRAWGGDTLNTAVYLARLGMKVDYITALGDDTWSDAMISGWRAEGVGVDRVGRIAGRLPGLYVIQTDARGERRFAYWRDSAPARDIFSLPSTPDLCAALTRYSHIYISGISLSLYGAAGREALFQALQAARATGTVVAFDTNFRPRGWPDRAEAQRAYHHAFATADMIFASVEDLDQLFGERDSTTAYHATAEVVLKLERPTCLVFAEGTRSEISAQPVADVVDTTAAGDSFAAAYLAARISGASPTDAARAGHRLAGVVVQHHGAIIPRSAMPVQARTP